MTRSKTILDFVARHREQQAILQGQQQPSMSDFLVATSKEITARNNITARLRESADLDAVYGFDTPEVINFDNVL